MTALQLRALIDLYGPALALLARQYARAADDAVQLAFCKLVRQKPPPVDSAAWLFRTVRHAAIDLGKAERRRHRREVASAKPEAWFAGDSLEADEAVSALRGLPAEQREVIVLRLWSDLSLEAIAAACDCSISTVHRRYEAGLDALRKRLGEPCRTKTSTD